MNSTEKIASIAEALAAAQAEIQNPHKNREVTVRPREGAPYSFSYATLDGILDGVRPILAKHGIAIVQTMVLIGDNKTPAMRTTLLHKSGESIGTDVPMTIERNGNQALGSAMTYARRYGLIGLLAIAADEDDDGNSADGNSVEARRERGPAPARQSPGGPTSPPRREPNNDMGTNGQRGERIAPAPTLVRSGEAAAAKAEFERLTASLNAKLGAEEAGHQIAAIKKRNGDKWQTTLAEVSALDASTPAPRN
jgi:hypothetical protein